MSSVTPGLIEAFTSNQDIHNATAARVFGVDPAAVTVEQRSKAKMVSYGLAYGMEAYGLGQRLNISTEEAALILDAYFVAFPNVKAYMDHTVAEARERGYTETLFGRRRPIPELMNSNYRVRQAGERQAMNAGIQGLAADIFKVALVHIDSDIYSSAKTVLDNVAPRLRVGSVIVFNEYFNYPNWRQHEFRAFQEFCAAHGVTYRYLCWAMYEVAVRITSIGGEAAG